MQARLARPALPCGRVVVAVSAEKGAQRIALEVVPLPAQGGQGQTTVGQCSAAGEDEPADVTCPDELTATRLLLGHLPCGYVMDLSAAAGVKAAEAAWRLDVWCPLPIHWNKQDAI